MERPRERKEKGSKPKGKSKGKNAPRSIAPRPTQSSPTKSERSQPKSKPEARSRMTNDFLFAMISTKLETLYMEWHRLYDLHSGRTSEEATSVQSG